MTRAGNSAFQQPLFLFPFKKVSDFITCGKNQRNKLKEAQHVFGADQKHRTFESRWEEREHVYPAFTMCQTQAWECLLCPPLVDSARIKSKFLTTDHQEVRSQSYWTPGSNTMRDQCIKKLPFNQQPRHHMTHSSINILGMAGSWASPLPPAISMATQVSHMKCMVFVYNLCISFHML